MAANTVEQTVSINLQGGGSLPATLKEAIALAKQLETGAKKAAAAGQVNTANYLSGQASLARKDIGPAGALYESAQRERESSRTKLAGAVGGLGAAATGTAFGGVALSDPWAMNRFAKASADLAAVIGRDLVPYVELATKGVRLLADTWASLPAPIRHLGALAIAATAVIGGTTLAVIGLNRSLAALGITANAAAAATAKQSAANIVGGTGAGAAGAAAGAGLLARLGPWGIAAGIAALVVGGLAVSQAKSGSSFGAAVRDTGVTSAEGYLDSLQTDVLKNTGEKTNELLESIKEILQIDQLEETANIVGQLALSPVALGNEIARWTVRQFE